MAAVMSRGFNCRGNQKKKCKEVGGSIPISGSARKPRSPPTDVQQFLASQEEANRPFLLQKKRGEREKKKKRILIPFPICIIWSSAAFSRPLSFPSPPPFPFRYLLLPPPPPSALSIYKFTCETDFPSLLLPHSLDIAWVPATPRYPKPPTFRPLLT